MLRLGKSLNYWFLESWEKKYLFKFAFYVFLSFSLDFLWVNCLSLSKLVLNSFGLNWFRLKLSSTTAKFQSIPKHLVKHVWRLDEHSAVQVTARTLDLSGDRNTFVLSTHTFQSKHKNLSCTVSKLWMPTRHEVCCPREEVTSSCLPPASRSHLQAPAVPMTVTSTSSNSSSGCVGCRPSCVWEQVCSSHLPFP